MTITSSLLTPNSIITVHNVFPLCYAAAIPASLLFIIVHHFTSLNVNTKLKASLYFIYWILCFSLILFTAKLFYAGLMMPTIAIIASFLTNIQIQSKTYPFGVTFSKNYFSTNFNNYFQRIAASSYVKTNVKKLKFFKIFAIHSGIFSFCAHFSCLIATNSGLYSSYECQQLILNFIVAICLSAAIYTFFSVIGKKSSAKKKLFSLTISEILFCNWLILAIPFFAILGAIYYFSPSLFAKILTLNISSKISFRDFLKISILTLYPPVLINIMNIISKERFIAVSRLSNESHEYKIDSYIQITNALIFFAISLLIFYVLDYSHLSQSFKLKSWPYSLYLVFNFFFLFSSNFSIPLPGDCLYLKKEQHFVTVWKFGFLGYVIKYPNSSESNLYYHKAMGNSINYSKENRVNPAFSISVSRKKISSITIDRASEIVKSNSNLADENNLDLELFYNEESSKLEISFWVEKSKSEIPSIIYNLERKIQTYFSVL